MFACESKRQGCPLTHSGLNKHSDALIRNSAGGGGGRMVLGSQRAPH